ncbi:heme-binding protein [Thiorhodococcus mannitoliphagus]|uniref:Heme-binding protein n=1 Tax=Thiorhodococcus mannitoliphagus TaxID=329406 RepID=A0A6P1DNT8_9GAMM|nr:heme-binding protein [Thiorhodococcus mannitoliphagus]NEX19599.1 heme-binding protein [Thiorhodococcus mannitoliphagus]
MRWPSKEPSFEVVHTYPMFELRRYEAYLVATTEVTGDFDKVGNEAFRVLADYIFGNNQSKTKMAMTAPVNQQPAEGEKIEMTAPVTQRPSGPHEDRYLLSFVMPSGYRLDTLPTPNNPRVTLHEEPARLMAVRRYSGRWTYSNYEDNRRILLMAVEEAKLKAIGDPVYARYNPPFTPWFLRRNEVMVEIAPAGDAAD